MTVADLRSDETKHLDAEIARAVAAERERCAKIIEGRVHKEIYREWPWWGPGNRARGSEMVKFCDAAAAAMRSHG